MTRLVMFQLTPLMRGRLTRTGFVHVYIILHYFSCNVNPLYYHRGKILYLQANSAEYSKCEQGPSMAAECRCKKCGACVAVTEAMEIAEPSVEAREKVEIRMYGVGIHSDEAWVWLTTREERFRRILRKANVKATHMDPLGRFHVFLFLTPKARDKAFDILKRHFETAFAIYTPLLAVMPDKEETNVYRKREN